MHVQRDSTPRAERSLHKLDGALRDLTAMCTI